MRLDRGVERLADDGAQFIFRVMLGQQGGARTLCRETFIQRFSYEGVSFPIVNGSGQESPYFAILLLNPVQNNSTQLY